METVSKITRVRVEVGKEWYSVFDVYTDRHGNATSWANHRTFYTANEVPTWIKEGVAMLDLANVDKVLSSPTTLPGVGYAVPGIGIYYLDYKGERP